MKYILLSIAFFIYACESKTGTNVDKKKSNFEIINGEFDVGVVAIDTIVNGFFVVSNNTKKNITYKNIIVNCNCTNLDIKSGDQLKPQEIDTINFTLNTHNIGNNTLIEECIRVITDSKPDLHRFYIVGKVN